MLHFKKKSVKMINSTTESETKHDSGLLISSEDSEDMKQCYRKAK